MSHIHMFGIPFIFFIVGLIFTPRLCAAGMVQMRRHRACRSWAIMVDVSSWYMIKVFHPFAWVEILAGALMAACFAYMWLVTMYQMWFHKPPEAILARMGGDIPDYWTVD